MQAKDFLLAIYKFTTDIKSVLGINQSVLSYSTVPGNTYIWPDNVTWTAADNGSGKVRLTSSAVHNMSEALAEGSYLYLISGGTGWTAGTSHRITPVTGYVDTTHIDLDTAYTAGMGVPVFAIKGTVEANSYVPLLNIMLPALDNNTSMVWELGVEFSSDGTSAAKRIQTYLDGVQISNTNLANTNTQNPLRHGFTNQNSKTSQRGLSAANSTGYTGNTTAPTALSVDTSSAGKVLSVGAMLNVAGVTARIGSYYLIRRD